jgi:hypothetical protein
MESEVKRIVTNIRDKLLDIWNTARIVSRGMAVERVEFEAEELDHIFGLLVLGSFVGLPSPPMQLSLDLMPLMEEELMLMTEKVDTAHEPISDLFAELDIG